MQNHIKGTWLLIGMLLLASCSTVPPVENQGPRTLLLSGEEFKEEEFGKFKTWVCTDFVSPKGVLVEVGIFSGIEKEGYGFVLYEGGNSGEITIYQRKGVNHRWDWGKRGEYAFVIKPDGTGLFYDFSMGKEGEAIKANDVYKCYKR